MEIKQTNLGGANPQLGMGAQNSESVKNNLKLEVRQTNTNEVRGICGIGKSTEFAWFLILAMETIIEVLKVHYSLVSRSIPSLYGPGHSSMTLSNAICLIPVMRVNILRKT